MHVYAHVKCILHDFVSVFGHLILYENVTQSDGLKKNCIVGIVNQHL